MISWVGFTANLKRLSKAPSEPIKPIIYKNAAYHIDELGLTKDGDPFVIEKYCVMLANQVSTHVMLFKDNRIKGRWGVEVIEDDIEWSKPFDECSLKKSDGLGKVYAWYYDKHPLLAETVKKLRTIKEESQTPVFMIPCHLIESPSNEFGL